MLTKVFCILITAAFNILISINVDRNQDIEGSGDHLTDSNPAALLHPETSMLSSSCFPSSFIVICANKMEDPVSKKTQPDLLERYPARGVYCEEKTLVVHRKIL
jgi:hypothetical protein